MSSTYDTIISAVFKQNYTHGGNEFEFTRDEMADAAEEAGIDVPKNLGDVIYTFRYRRDLPDEIRNVGVPAGEEWRIRGAGPGIYRFLVGPPAAIVPTPGSAVIKVLDATPGIIERYAITDEQALLARLRYNRLLDVFLGITTYSLQNHLRTSVPALGQVETDELYVGLDRRGAHYIIPVQAKGGSDIASKVQIEQDFEMCRLKFPDPIARPIAAQFMGETIALFEFELDSDDFAVISRERHYELVPPAKLSDAELVQYRQATYD